MINDNKNDPRDGWYRQMVYMCPACRNKSYHSTIALKEKWVDPDVTGVEGCLVCSDRASARMSSREDVQNVLSDIQSELAEIANIVGEWLEDYPDAQEHACRYMRWSYDKQGDIRDWSVSLFDVWGLEFLPLRSEKSKLMKRLKSVDSKLLRSFNKTQIML